MPRKLNPARLRRKPRQPIHDVYYLAHQFYDFWLEKGAGLYRPVPHRWARELFRGMRWREGVEGEPGTISFEDGSWCRADLERVYTHNRGRNLGPGKRNGMARIADPTQAGDLPEADTPIGEGPLELL